MILKCSKTNRHQVRDRIAIPRHKNNQIYSFHLIWRRLKRFLSSVLYYRKHNSSFCFLSPIHATPMGHKPTGVTAYILWVLRGFSSCRMPSCNFNHICQKLSHLLPRKLYKSRLLYLMKNIIYDDPIIVIYVVCYVS